MTNPFEHSEKRAAQVSESVGLDLARVVGTSPENHAIAAQPITSTGTEQTKSTGENVAVTVPEHGDVAMPSVGDLVVLASFRADTKIVLGTFYDDAGDIPSVVEGERVISHDDSDTTIRLKPNGDVEIDAENNVIVDGGDVEINPDGAVKIDGGGTNVVTDVETTKDADGHVTDITIVRAQSTEVNSS